MQYNRITWGNVHQMFSSTLVLGHKIKCLRSKLSISVCLEPSLENENTKNLKFLKIAKVAENSAKKKINVQCLFKNLSK